MYDDGDKEFKMKPDTIRILEKVGHHKKIVGNVPVDGPDFKEGSVVEGVFNGAFFSASFKYDLCTFVTTPSSVLIS